MQETRDADLLLHVIDAHDPERQAKIEQVRVVLAEIGANEVPQLEVYNKIDLLEQGQPQLERNSDGQPLRVHLSAVSGAGVELLLQAVADFFREVMVQSRLCLPPSAGRLRAALYAIQAVRREQVEDSGAWLLDVEIKAHDLAQLRKQQDFAPLLPALQAEG